MFTYRNPSIDNRSTVTNQYLSPPGWRDRLSSLDGRPHSRLLRLDEPVGRRTGARHVPRLRIPDGKRRSVLTTGAKIVVS